jgi:parallel beta-helix repeat protein
VKSLALALVSVLGLPLLLAMAPACSSSSSGSSSSNGIGSSSPLCTGSGRCIAISPSAAETDIDGAAATTQNGDTLAFAAGTYTFQNQLALGTGNDVTVIGAGQGKTIFNFANQVQGDDAIFAQSIKNLTLEDFTVENSPGNAVKTLSVTGVTYRSLQITWSALNDTDGGYGLYPVQCTDVMAEDNNVSGASDSGIYIGQSQYIVVRNNTVFNNVAGIEIENSFFADVYGNTTHDNTGGILVFDLPNLQQEGGHNVRVYSNTIENNNTENFAVSGDIVGDVPAGTGFFVMANHDVEVFDNTITGNKTVGAGIISYALAMMSYTDPNYYQWPKNIYLHDNKYSGNGSEPDIRNKVGLLLDTALGSYPDMHVPDVMYDGLVDPSVVNTANPNDPMEICVDETDASAVCDMHFNLLNANDTNLATIMTCTASTFACTLPALPPVTWAGMPQ